MKALYLQSLYYYEFQESYTQIDIAECGECGNQSVVNVVISCDRFIIHGIAPSTKRKTLPALPRVFFP